MNDPYYTAQRRIKESAAAVAIFVIVYLIAKITGMAP